MEEQKILIGLDYGLASPELIEVLIEDPTDDAIFDEIARANTGRPEILQLLFAHSRTPEEVRKLVSGSLHLPEKVSREIAKPEKAEHTEEMRAHSLQQKIQRLTVSERIHLAMRGGREIRNILIKDTNKEVMMSVLENQKMTETEVEMIARSRSVPEEILRRITKNRDWMKNYAVVFALVTNPKTPAGIAVGLVSDLKPRDLGLLEKNKNISEAVRSAAKRLISARRPK